MNVNKLPGSKVQFEVVIPVELFKKAVDDAFEKKIKTVEVKGFRKGQAPRNVYEAQYGVESLYDDALNSAISETYYEAVRDNKIDVCGYPKIDIDTRKINPEEPIHYFVTVSVTPEVTLGEYKGLQIVKETVKVSKKEVEDEIKAALERDAMMATKEDGIIEKGNTAKFDFEGKVDGVAFEGGTAKDYELEIGSGQFIPGFEDQMIGMKVGETKDINVTFPEDYHAENLKGKAAVFTVSVKEVKVKELPELTVEWCNEQKHNHDGKELKFETVEDYKNHIKEHIKEHKEEHAKAEAQNKLFETVIANAKFELPEDLVEEDVESEFKNAEAQAKQYNMPLEMLLMYTGGGTVEQFKENLKKQATQRLSLRFVLKAIAEKENFEVTEEEINKEYQDLAEHYKMTEEQVRQAVDAESIKEEIKSQKAYKLIEDANPFVAPQKK